MNLFEYDTGKFVNLKYIVQISVLSVDAGPAARPASFADRESGREQIGVFLKTEGEAAPVRVTPPHVPRFVRFFPEVGTRVQELEAALFKAHVISALCRFPLAA
jgi:hypothetical protein